MGADAFIAFYGIRDLLEALDARTGCRSENAWRHGLQVYCGGRLTEQITSVTPHWLAGAADCLHVEAPLDSSPN
jgi:hypothetical protein